MALNKQNLLQISKNKNFRNGILYTIFSFANNGISFILLLVLTRFLEPSDYGSLSLFNTFVTLLNIFISLSTTSYVSVSYFHVQRDTIKKIILICLSTSTISLSIFSIFLYVGYDIAVELVGIDIEYLWIGTLICYFQVYTTLNLETWRLEERPLSYGVFSISFAVLNFIVTLWLIIGLNFNWTGRAYSQGIVSFLFFIISLFFLCKNDYISLRIPSKRLIIETFIYSLPLVPHVISFWLRQGFDRYIINYFFGRTDVGFFSFAMNISSILVMIGSAFNSTNSVYIFKKLSAGYLGSRALLKRQEKMMTCVFILCCLMIISLSIGLIIWVIPNYYGCLPFLVPLCLGGLFQCLYLLWVNYLFYYKYTRQLMYITFSSSLLQVLMSIWLTRYSPIITAWISMLVNFLIFILVYIKVKSILLKQIKIENEKTEGI